jgi:hypothetical protein
MSRAAVMKSRDYVVLPESWGLMVAEESEFGIMRAIEFGSKLDLIHRPGTVWPSDRAVYQITCGFSAVRLWR